MKNLNKKYMKKIIESPEELRELMDSYRNDWLESRNQIVSIIRVFRENISDKEKLDKINNIVNTALPKQKIE